jgi:mRNA-degrading endonuclease RelE of RelBE toxin-antitoxin system
MAYKITLLDGALEDLDIAFSWYSEIHVELAKDLVFKFKEALSKIELNPFLSQNLSSGFRKVNLHRFPYKLIFEINDTEIIVVALAHHKRKPGYWKNR